MKNILISQQRPVGDNSPYFDLEKNYKTKIEFCPFFRVEGLDAKNVRLQKIDFSNYSAVVFTSKSAIDHYFRLAEEMRFQVPDSMKYICQSETIALYLQRYIVYRKRKIYFGEKNVESLIPVLKKHSSEKFLIPSSETLNPDLQKLFDDFKLNWSQAILFQTVSCDLSKTIENIKDYDILVFFSHHDIQSLTENFPNFKQGETKIAAFGSFTQQAVAKAGLKVTIKAPTKESPSMAMALENYLKLSLITS